MEIDSVAPEISSNARAEFRGFPPYPSSDGMYISHLSPSRVTWRHSFVASVPLAAQFSFAARRHNLAARPAPVPGAATSVVSALGAVRDESLWERVRCVFLRDHKDFTRSAARVTLPVAPPRHAGEARTGTLYPVPRDSRHPTGLTNYRRGVKREADLRDPSGPGRRYAPVGREDPDAAGDPNVPVVIRGLPRGNPDAIQPVSAGRTARRAPPRAGPPAFPQPAAVAPHPGAVAAALHRRGTAPVSFPDALLYIPTSPAARDGTLQGWDVRDGRSHRHRLLECATPARRPGEGADAAQHVRRMGRGS
eukprot:gene15143-biopygen12225